jgi:hypothetical protein
MLTPLWDRRRAEWERVLREAFPLDLPPDRAVYFADAIDAGSHLTAGAAHTLAATSPSLDLQLRPRLETWGQWRGRGFAILLPDINRFMSRFSDAEQLGVFAHEFAHQLDAGDHWAESEGTGALLNAIRGEVVASVMIEMAARPRPPWDQHEVRFTRAALHLHHRLLSAGHPVPLASMFIAGPVFGLSPAESYREALGDELHDRTGEPIRDILKSPAPAKLMDLWQSDTATRGG